MPICKMEFPSIPAESLPNSKRLMLNIPEVRESSRRNSSISEGGPAPMEAPLATAIGTGLTTPAACRRDRRYGSAYLQSLNDGCDDNKMCPVLREALDESSSEFELLVRRNSSMECPLAEADAADAEAVGLPVGAPMWAVRSKSFKSFKSLKSMKSMKREPVSED